MAVKKRKYIIGIDLIRFVSCLSVVLYHLNILKGGYLAVCTFFVLSGYLSYTTYNKKASLLSYYKKRFTKLYLPLLIVVFTTIAITSLFPNIVWLNLKKETLSVLFGYNNFWQLSANLDYFTKQITSPFIHLWYIAILMQFDLIFPFIYRILDYIRQKKGKIYPCIIPTIFAGISAAAFCILVHTGNLMIPYYHTVTRIFSLLFGVTIGIIHTDFKIIIPESLKRKKKIQKRVFYGYLLALIILFIFIDASSPLLSLSVLLTTFISCRLIDYSIAVFKTKEPFIEVFCSPLSKISYEVYLLQYPVIYMFSYTKIMPYLKVTMIIIISIFLAYIYRLSFLKLRKTEYKYGAISGRLCLSLIAIFGAFQFFLAKDHTAEMKMLEEQLAQNELMLESIQAEYAEQVKKEEENWQAILDDLENGEAKIPEIVSNLPVVGIGDSIMLGAVNNLYKKFNNGYFDAKVSRSLWSGVGIINELNKTEPIKGPIVINLGANGDCSTSCKTQLIESCKDNLIFWVNVTNDHSVHINDKIASLANQYANLFVIDWASISKNHSEYFYADGIHLTEKGRVAYTDAIYNAIYQVYLDEYNAKKEETIRKHEEEQKNKISFFGNDLLLNGYQDLANDFSDATFHLKKDFNFDKIKKELNAAKEKGTLNHKVVFAFDSKARLTYQNYLSLFELCQEQEIYLLLTDKDSSSWEFNRDIKYINFYEELSSHEEYLMKDKIHLTDAGTSALINTLKETLK